MKLTPAMKKRFDETVNGFMEQGILPSYDDAVAKLDEISQGDLAKKLLEKFKTLDNEWVQSFLIDHFRDEVGRGLINPVMKVKFKVMSVRTYDAKEFDSKTNKPTGKTTKTTKAVGTASIMNKAGKWDKPKPAQIAGEEKFSDALDDAVSDGKCYTIDATCARPEQKMLFMDVSERGCNANEVEDDLPALEEILPDYFDKMPIHDAEAMKSKDNFELRLVEGIVVNHPLMPGGSSKRFTSTFQMSDSSVTPEDIASKGKKAYLTVQCPPEQISFGKDSIILVLGVVKWNPEDFLGPGFIKNPTIIAPIVRFDLPQQVPTATSGSDSSRPQHAADIIANITKAPSLAEKLAAQQKEKEKPAEEKPAEPKPRRRAAAPDADEAKFLEECQAFGKHDPKDSGCKACAKEYEKKGKPEHHIYPACTAKGE